MSHYFCPDCGRNLDDAWCDTCGASVGETLDFDEGSPDGRGGQYEPAVLHRISDEPEAPEPGDESLVDPDDDLE